MTQIICTINQSGSTTPLSGYVSVVSNNYLTSNTVFYTSTPVKYPLVNGTVTFDLLPTDIAKTAYHFSVVAVDTVAVTETILYQFDAVVPFSATPINMVTLAPQSGLRYDRRDASLLTLARFLVSNDSFINFLGNKLWKNKGTWDAVVVYQRGDVVLRFNSSYQYIASTQAANLAPESNPAAWSLLVIGGVAPVGTMLLYSTVATPSSGYLRCDGSAVSRNTYPSLYSVIGNTYGAGNGTTTFNLPNIAAIGASSFIMFAGL